MAIEPARLPPFEMMRNELAKFRASPMVLLSGKGALLDLLDAYLVSTDHRLRVLEGKANAKSEK